MNRLSLSLNCNAIHVVEHANEVILCPLLKSIDRVFTNTKVRTATGADLLRNKTLKGGSRNNSFNTRLLMANLTEGLRMKAARLLLCLIHF